MTKPKFENMKNKNKIELNIQISINEYVNEVYKKDVLINDFRYAGRSNNLF